MVPAPLTMRLYRGLTRLVSPLALPLLYARKRKGKEDPARMREKLGHTGLPRPAGKLVWIHGASVGETMAALPLIDQLLAAGDMHVLVTSGTLTSAKLLARRLPEGAIHQFVPLDIPSAVARFLNHWQPDLGLFVDSDIWPNLISAARARDIPLAVINARISEKSYQRWAKTPRSANYLFGLFDAVLAQDGDIAARFRFLGAKHVRITGALKADAAAPAAEPEKLAALQVEIAGRPVFLAAQTHGGEEETLLPASDGLRRKFPDLLTIIIPRHTKRAADIAALCGARPVAIRSKGDAITAKTEIYIADTMGEMGLFYRLARFAFVGGSLIRHGGQNPLEPAKLARAVLSGPHYFNFTSACRTIFAAQGFGEVASAADIVALAEKLLADPDFADEAGRKAAAGAHSLSGATAETLAFIREVFDARA